MTLKHKSDAPSRQAKDCHKIPPPALYGVTKPPPYRALVMRGLRFESAAKGSVFGTLTTIGGRSGFEEVVSQTVDLHLIRAAHALAGIHQPSAFFQIVKTFYYGLTVLACSFGDVFYGRPADSPVVGRVGKSHEHEF
jgi:hypothetical protein